ncbi:serine/threonine-protein kinase [Kineococcus sp. G2]|uniref:serine/threonine-protein kinase n=1 Tax=Kineococcus sp. G2 TaxID=3127484 RepID=UPI00301BAEAC
MPLDDTPPGRVPGPSPADPSPAPAADLPGHPVRTGAGDPVAGVRAVRSGRHAAEDPAGVPGAGLAGAVRAARRAALAELGEDPRDLPPRVDGYEVGDLLGAGGSAVVWSGTGPDGVPCALKVLHPVRGATAAADPLHELSLLRRVRHPRVVAVRDISRDGDGNAVLVLDLAPGGSLAQVVRRRHRLGAAEVVGLLSVLGPALEELHSAGVVHGDVAPGNVLLDARGEPLLADLGLARALGRPHGSVLGTPGFADPAVVAGGDLGAAADVYGLAAVAWWALTGRVPPSGAAGAGRRAVRRAGAELPAGTSAELLAVLREGLHRKPSRRPTPGELAQAAAGCAQPRPLRAVAREWAPAGPLRRPGPVGGPVGAPVGGATGEPSGRVADGGRAGVAAPVVPVTRPVGRATPPLPLAGAADPADPGSGAAAVAGRRAPRAAAGTRPLPRRLLAGGVAALVVAGALTAAVLLRPGAPAADAADAAGTAPAATPGGPEAPVAVGGGVGGDAAAPGSASSPPSSSPEVPAPAEGVGDRVLRDGDAGAVVRELAARRADALRAADAAALLAVDAPGSPALASDTALLEQVVAEGSRWSGLGFDVTAVEVESAGPEQLVVVADVVTQAHEVLGPGGSVTSVAPSAPRTSRLTLVRVEGHWRVQAVG